MSTEEKEDTQLRVRKITNGFLVLSRGAQFYCSDIENVLIRINNLLVDQMQPFDSTAKQGPKIPTIIRKQHP